MHNIVLPRDFTGENRRPQVTTRNTMFYNEYMPS